jgi:ribonuclease D
MQIITTTSDLADLCARLSRHDHVTVDTEFMRETTYYPKLCLIQIASADEAAIIDPQADNIDLTPFFALMGDESVLKVFHSARQDLEIVWTLGRLIPKPLFDTQVAAMVCGYGDQVSYEQLVNDLAKAKVDKSSRFTDWSRRPLSQAQLDYAVSDVTYLRDVYAALKSDLESNGRGEWLEEEMAILASPATYEVAPEDAWKRLAGRVRKTREIGILMELAAWREVEARTRDVPRSRVLKDDVMMDICVSAPKTPEALSQLRSIPKGFERSKSGSDILEAVSRGLERDPKSIAAPTRDKHRPSGGATLDLLKVLLKSVCENEKVAPKILANVDDLEDIVADDHADVAALKGWRRQLFGDLALSLKHGEIALCVKKGRVTVVHSKPPLAE